MDQLHHDHFADTRAATEPPPANDGAPDCEAPDSSIDILQALLMCPGFVTRDSWGQLKIIHRFELKDDDVAIETQPAEIDDPKGRDRKTVLFLSPLVCINLLSLLEQCLGDRIADRHGPSCLINPEVGRFLVPLHAEISSAAEAKEFLKVVLRCSSDSLN